MRKSYNWIRNTNIEGAEPNPEPGHGKGIYGLRSFYEKPEQAERRDTAVCLGNGLKLTERGGEKHAEKHTVGLSDCRRKVTVCEEQKSLVEWIYKAYDERTSALRIDAI